MFRRRDRDSELERRLSAERPEAPEELTRRLAARLGPGRPARHTRPAADRADRRNHGGVRRLAGGGRGDRLGSRVDPCVLERGASPRAGPFDAPKRTRVRSIQDSGSAAGSGSRRHSYWSQAERFQSATAPRSSRWTCSTISGTSRTAASRPATATSTGSTTISRIFREAVKRHGVRSVHPSAA